MLALVAGAAACASDRTQGARAETATLPRGDSLAEVTRHGTLRDLAALADALDTLRAAAAALDVTPARSTGVREAFIAARQRWKHVEWLVEAYTPSSARQLNGPPLPEVEITEGHQPVRPPEGFQVVEALLWPEVQVDARDALVGEVATMQQTLTRVRQLLSANRLLDGIVWDAGRTELARVATLGLGGFDSPLAQRQLIEARDALRGVQAGIAPYRGRARAQASVAWDALER
ncbi:MAG: hypothetical protein MUE41_12095, partial [Gemmatimonadaceae bacterium]|nr:hypothetical protein [Gemmatimonadaceae bacterium]